MPRVERVLEIGCGNAAGSALLSDRARLVVATDLPKVDVATHSIGMTAPRRLLDWLGVENCRLAGASAEVLPFGDETFDLVFSLFVLEHVPNREAAVQEMHRVLRPGGYAVAFVPNYVERLYAPFAFYVYLLGRLKERAARRLGRGNLHSAAPTEDGESPTPARRPFREAYPHFPIPSPHGEYRHSLEELLAHRPGRWRALFERHAFEVERQAFTMTIPLNVIGPMVGARIWALYERAAGVDRLLGRTAVGRHLGQYGFLVARRREG
jgi:SAM-dependent methyltransferase